MTVYKFHDINGNTYGIKIDYENKKYYKSPLLSISDLIGGIKTTRKHLRQLETDLKIAGFIEVKPNY